MSKDRTKISFAEAEGKVRFPKLLEWGALDQRVRSTLWNVFYPVFTNYIYDPQDGLSDASYSSPLDGILYREYVQRRHGFGNEFKSEFSDGREAIDEWAKFFKTADYIELFDFITFFLRDAACPPGLIGAVADALDEPWSPFRPQPRLCQR